MDAPSQAPASPQMWRPPIGSVLHGRYRLLSLVGEGAIGSVYRAERLEIDRPVAVKFLQAEMARDPSFVQRFHVEALAMARLAHPNCISVIDFGVEKLPYLVMDFVDGVSLRRLIEGGPLPPARAVAIASQLLAGLAHAHAKGVIHRDVKPENIVIERGMGLDGDHVRILDFGMAKLLDGGSMLTLGMFLGTPNYMAPEQMAEGELDERADVYAAGIILYEMLTGRQPFDRPSIPEILLAQKETPPPPFRAIAPGVAVSSALETVVRRALQKSPAARFSSALAMREALEGLGELVPVEGAVPVDSRPAAPDATLLDARPWGAFGSERGTKDGAGAAISSRQPLGHRVGRLVQNLLAAVARLAARIEARLRPSLAAAARRAWGAVQASWTRWRLLPIRARRIAAGAAALVLGSAVLVVVAALPAKRGDGGASGREAREAADDPRAVAAGLAEPSTASSDRGASAGSPRSTDGGADWREQAAALRALVKRHPEDARHPAALARLLFERRRYTQGLAHFRLAIRRDRNLRGDAVLIVHVIDGLAVDGFAQDAEDFLRQLGKDARPHVRQAAGDHRNLRVRARCRQLLQSWTRRPFLQWR